MSVHTLSFYTIAVLILAATGMAVTRANLVHAVVYLVLSFFGSAMLFYLLGAPLLAALEVIIYAGAIMILFLFIIMMMDIDRLAEQAMPVRQWLPAAGLGLVYLMVMGRVILTDPGGRAPLQAAVAQPRAFGEYLFSHHWLAIEIASLLLLIVLFGVLHLGQGRGGDAGANPETTPPDGSQAEVK